MSGVKIGRLSWIFPRGPNVVTVLRKKKRVSKEWSREIQCEKDLANMAESKDEETGPEDMGNEGKS